MLAPVHRLTLASLLLGACASTPAPTGIPALGNGTHSTAAVTITTIAGPDVLFQPTDVALDPAVPTSLWVTVRESGGIVVIDDVGGAAQTTMLEANFGAVHFLPRPAALAFGQPGTLATIHDISIPTQSSTPGDFMGPTLWSTDRSLFDGGHASHLDMLHNSPNGVGIAWDHDNVYWVIDGWHSSITRYDFRMDHGPGNEDHSDGIIARYVEGEIQYVENVPAHAVLDHETGLLYVADPGRSRVLTLDTASGTRGADLPFRENYDGGEMYQMRDAVLEVAIDGAEVGLVEPSGLAIADGVLYVTDHFTSIVAAFDLETRELVDYLGLGEMAPAGSLAGIEIDATGQIYVADQLGSRVLRISAPITR
jgi:DNA-binding beta-propeller fold protein YncE